MVVEILDPNDLIFHVKYIFFVSGLIYLLLHSLEDVPVPKGSPIIFDFPGAPKTISKFYWDFQDGNISAHIHVR